MLTENENRVLAVLAEGSLTFPTKYGIAKSLHLGSSSVQYLVNELTERNLLQVGSSNRWRTGRIRRELNVTFVGTVFYLAMVEIEKKLSYKGYRATVRNFVKSQGSSLGYPPFAEFDEIDEPPRNRGATAKWFCSTAHLLLTYFGQLAPCPWNAFTFRSLGIKTMRQAASVETEEKGKQEEAWREAFAKILLESYLQPQSPPVWRNNQSLNSFYIEMLLRQEEKKREELERIVIDRKHLQQYRKLIPILDAT